MSRIGIIIYSLAGAGAERVSVNLSRNFVEQGHQVDFVLSSGEGELIDELISDIGIYSAKKATAKDWRKAIALYVKNAKPDVLLAMMEGAGIIAIQTLKAIRSKVPVYVVSHVHFSKHCKSSKRLKERYLMPIAARWFLPHARAVIGVSDGVTEDISQSAGLSKKQVITIYNPVISTDFEKKTSEAVVHPWLIKDRDWLTVITVGRLTKQKAHEILIEAIYKANKKCDVRLLVIGQGERDSALNEQVKKLNLCEKVQFLGFKINPYSYIAHADVFALSSAWEGFGNVLVEALAAGTAVVSTDCPSGPSEILAEGRFGQLVPVANSNALAEAILAANNYPIDDLNLTEHLDQFRSTTVAKKYLNLMGISVS